MERLGNLNQDPFSRAKVKSSKEFGRVQDMKFVIEVEEIDVWLWNSACCGGALTISRVPTERNAFIYTQRKSGVPHTIKPVRYTVPLPPSSFA